MHTLLLALASFLPADVDGAAPVTVEIGGGAGLVLRLEETRLVAESRSLEPFVLVFAGPGRAHAMARTLLPGATLVAQHPPQGRVGVWLEVLAAQDGRLATSGALALDGGTRLVVLEQDARGLHVAASDPAGLRRAQGFLKMQEPPAGTTPLHVPIPAPSEKSQGNTPPPVEKEPLPPV